LIVAERSKMKVFSASTTGFVVLLSYVPTIFVAGDQNGGNYGYDNSNMYQSFTVCADTAIEVQDVQLYCDSPGTFYYGSGKYRNSQNCTAGDKGKYIVDFYIKDPDTIESTGGFPVLDVAAVGTIGWYQADQQVVENIDLCSFDSLKSLSGNACPAEGKYRISSHFYWDEDTSYSGHFDPKLEVGFKSSIYQNTYDYGGANTQYCSGTTFMTSWTNGVKKAYANSFANFVKTFGILLFTITVMVSFIWFMINRPTSLEDAGKKLRFPKKKQPPPPSQEGLSSVDDEPSYANSEGFDFNKMKAQQSFLDF